MIRLAFLFAAVTALGSGVGETARTPVLVELFTSEGCSSCPPADALLMQLEKNQPVAGAEIIILSQHVDYWNHLGWSDPYSSREFSKRQEAYSAALGGDGVYTPQMIVDGRTEFNGSDARQARDAIGRASHTAKSAVAITSSATPDGVRLAIKAGSVNGKADVLVAITEGELRNSVTRGENSGKNLPHSGVVRHLRVIGTAGKEGFSGEQELRLDKSWKRQNLKAVVFLQDKNTRRVLGVATAPIPI